VEKEKEEAREEVQNEKEAEQDDPRSTFPEDGRRRK
jgi:hypothetical protein